jgi:integrase
MFERAGKVLRRPVLRRTRSEALKDLSGWASYDETDFMEKAAEKAKVGKLTFYELRHTYASGLVNKGVPLVFVASQLGHADIRMVQKHYGLLCPSALAESIRLLVPLLGLGGSLVAQPLDIKKG